MKTKLIGMIASIALMGSGAALAGGDWKQHDKQQQTQSQGATGGSGKVITNEGSSSTTQSGSATQGGAPRLCHPSEAVKRSTSGTLYSGSRRTSRRARPARRT